MALSRSMKNLMHDQAQARRGGGNPTSGGGMSGMVGRALQQGRDYGDLRDQNSPKTGRLPGQLAGLKTKVMQAREGAGGGMMRPAVEPRGPRGPVMPRGGVMGGPAGRRGPGTVAGKPRPAAGTFGFASRGGGGTPALQELTAGARTQAMGQRPAPPGGRVPRTAANVVGTAAARARGPAALAKPQGQSIASRIGGQQGPPARRGGMARALGSGGSRRRMLR